MNEADGRIERVEVVPAPGAVNRGNFDASIDAVIVAAPEHGVGHPVMAVADGEELFRILAHEPEPDRRDGAPQNFGSPAAGLKQ